LEDAERQGGAAVVGDNDVEIVGAAAGAWSKFCNRCRVAVLVSVVGAIEGHCGCRKGEAQDERERLGAHCDELLLVIDDGLMRRWYDFKEYSKRRRER
jgi:hypothetical protein